MRQSSPQSGLALANPSRESPLARARKGHALESRPRLVHRFGATESTENSRARHGVETLTSLEERQLGKILSQPMDYIDHAEYHASDATERIYGAAEINRPDVTWYRPLMDDFISARARAPVRPSRNRRYCSPARRSASCS